MWGLFRKRHPDDLDRLATAYRYFLKASDQADTDTLGDEGRQERKWKGGFGKALQQLYKQWPTPNESRRFERSMARSMKKSESMDRTFIHAFNDYLKQKRLTEDELSEVVGRGRDAYTAGSR